MKTNGSGTSAQELTEALGEAWHRLSAVQRAAEAVSAGHSTRSVVEAVAQSLVTGLGAGEAEVKVAPSGPDAGIRAKRRRAARLVPADRKSACALASESVTRSGRSCSAAAWLDHEANAADSAWLKSLAACVALSSEVEDLARAQECLAAELGRAWTVVAAHVAIADASRSSAGLTPRCAHKVAAGANALLAGEAAVLQTGPPRIRTVARCGEADALRELEAAIRTLGLHGQSRHAVSPHAGLPLSRLGPSGRQLLCCRLGDQHQAPAVLCVLLPADYRATRTHVAVLRSFAALCGGLLDPKR